MTARWVVDVVQPERDLEITWRPISLLLKNDPSPDSPDHAPVAHTHGLLRVFESLHAEKGNDAAFRFYWEAGRHIHHEQNYEVSAATILEGAGLDPSHKSAYDDESFDPIIRKKMNDGLALTGEEVGTPIIAFDHPSNPDERIGIFGPVISRKPEGQEGLELWDAMVTMATMESFWELKRTRTEGPDFGPPPAKP